MPGDVFSSEQLQDLYQRIVESGALGRSRVYAALLEYLLKSAGSGRSPKEIEIAIDVLGRGSDFDVSKDSVVRVYIHQLRKRLDTYYRKHDQEASHQIIIPKGQYTISAVPAQSAASPGSDCVAGGSAHDGGVPEGRLPRNRFALILMSVLIALLAVNVIIMSWPQPDTDASLSAATGIDRQIVEHPVWSTILNDELPILVVMGDYYIFGELDEHGRITRMVREFNINSRQDLSALFLSDQAMIGQYIDLDMTYMPEGSAYALAQITPILHSSGKRVEVTMMSRLSTNDLRKNHVIYIGYVSAMDKLHNLYFAASGLQVGRTYDELYNKGSQVFYTSDAGLPEQGQAFRDMGLLATFPAAQGNQFMIVAGTRDAGLMHAAQAVASTVSLQQVDNALSLSSERRQASHEALFEVFGMDRMNFDANLLYAQEIDPRQVWGNAPASTR